MNEKVLKDIKKKKYKLDHEFSGGFKATKKTKDSDVTLIYKQRCAKCSARIIRGKCFSCKKEFAKPIGMPRIRSFKVEGVDPTPE